MYRSGGCKSNKYKGKVMPPKRKKQVCKRTCEVKRCKDKIIGIWGDYPGTEKINCFGICGKHFSKHHDKKDKFFLYKEFGISKQGTVGSVDRFGFPLARDHDEFKDYLVTQEKKDNSESIKKLQNWKEKNKDKKKKKKYKPKQIKAKRPRQTLANIKTKEVSNNEMDNVLAGILGE